MEEYVAKATKYTLKAAMEILQSHIHSAQLYVIPILKSSSASCASTITHLQHYLCNTRGKKSTSNILPQLTDGGYHYTYSTSDLPGTSCTAKGTGSKLFGKKTSSL